MDITQMNILVTVAGFVLIFVSGYWLYKNEQPFNVVVLTIHKLLSVALIVYQVLAVLKIGKTAPLGQAELIACIVTGLLFLGAVITGGVLSAAKTMPAVVQMSHKALSALTVISTAATLFLLYRGK